MCVLIYKHEKKQLFDLPVYDNFTQNNRLWHKVQEVYLQTCNILIILGLAALCLTYAV